MRTLLALLAVTLPTLAAEEAIFAPDAKLKVETGKGTAGEGPAWHPHLGILTSGNGHICQLAPDGTAHIFRKDAHTNGLLFDAQGRLLACEPNQRRVTRTEADGKVTVLADRFDGKRFNQPNDLTVDAHGRIYFSDPRYGPTAGKDILDEKGRTIEGVYRIDPDGKVARVIGREVERANGVLVSGDGKYLYVADNNNDVVGGARKLWRFDLRKDGSVDLKSQKLLHDWGKGRGPDGIKQDQLGRLYVAGGLNKPHPPTEPATDVKGGIYVFSPEGKLLTMLPVPTDEVTNCAFGGADGKMLYITGGGTLYSIRTTSPGRLIYPSKKDHVFLTPDALHWQNGPPSLEKGAKFVVLEGDPSKEGPFVLRLKLPDGFRVAPHTHPQDERVTVLSGTLYLGMGAAFDEKHAKALPAGSFGITPAGEKHFGYVKGETVLQLHGVGPWAINYLNAQDDPRNRK